MQATSYPDINIVLDILLSQIQSILGKKLVGLYLHGSLVIGDFDPNISDIDLVAPLSTEVDDREFEALQKMHAAFAARHKEWDDRIEVCYISIAALKAVRSRTSTIANISPGEPFHRKESRIEWLTNWYLVREKSITLFGPSPKTLIEPISKDEFIQAIKAHAKAWREWMQDMHIGNIHLADVRAWYEERTTAAGLIHREPLWGDPPSRLVREFLARGYAALLTCIEEARANPTWLGAPLTEKLIQAFEQAGIDPCGERGEYHTFVYAGPLFSSPLAFRLGERLSLSGFQLIDIQPQSGAH